MGLMCKMGVIAHKLIRPALGDVVQFGNGGTVVLRTADAAATLLAIVSDESEDVLAQQEDGSEVAGREYMDGTTGIKPVWVK